MADEQQQGGAPEGDQPSEEEVRAQLEEEIKKVKVEDVILQSLVSILNLAARRIAKEDERDLAQGKQGIDAARALVDFVPEDAQKQINEALSELQLLYAKEAGGDGGADGGGDEPPKSPPGKGDSGLWTPQSG